MSPLPPKDEQAGSEILSRYPILHTLQEPALDDLARLAANICRTPVALIGLYDRGRHWFISKVGIDLSRSAEEEPFSARAADGSDIMIVPDALSDERFLSHPWVISEPYVRFYAGAPLTTPEGIGVGALSVLDRIPRSLEAAQVDALRTLSRQVMAQMEIRRMASDRALIRSIFNAAGEGICSLDPEGRAADVNPAAARMFGWSPEELIGKNIHQMVHHSYPDGRPYPEERCPIYGTVRNGQVCHMANDLFFRKDGTSFPVEYTSAPIVRDGRNLGVVVVVRNVTDRRRVMGNQIGVIGVSSDITEQKTAKEALRQKTIEAEEANRLKSHFVSLVSHELRTPMNAILGFTQLLKNPNYGGNAAKRAKMLDRIHYNAKVFLDLINTLLDLSKIEEGQMTVQREEVSLVEIVTEVVNNLRLLAEKKGLPLVLIQEAGTPVLCSDRTKLAQIFTNLVANAIKFTERGSILIRLLPRIEEKEVWVEVSDTGIGMSEDQIAHLFKPFYQADPAGGEPHEGTGLALSIVEKLVNLIGGKIEVASWPDEGSLFTVRLPIASGLPDQCPADRDRSPG